jgi:hypothetical protein
MSVLRSSGARKNKLPLGAMNIWLLRSQARRCPLKASFLLVQLPLVCPRESAAQRLNSEL